MIITYFVAYFAFGQLYLQKMMKRMTSCKKTNSDLDNVLEGKIVPFRARRRGFVERCTMFLYDC